MVLRKSLPFLNVTYLPDTPSFDTFHNRPGSPILKGSSSEGWLTAKNYAFIQIGEELLTNVRLLRRIPGRLLTRCDVGYRSSSLHSRRPSKPSTALPSPTRSSTSNRSYVHRAFSSRYPISSVISRRSRVFDTPGPANHRPGTRTSSQSSYTCRRRARIQSTQSITCQAAPRLSSSSSFPH